jgi:hypothetical protein
MFLPSLLHDYRALSKRGLCNQFWLSAKSRSSDVIANAFLLRLKSRAATLVPRLPGRDGLG